LWRELALGLLNGNLWALVVAVVAVLWFKDMQLGLIFGVALVLNLLTGALAGTLVPMVLQRLGIDPALAGGVVLTTATDVVGFFSFLGLATLFLFKRQIYENQRMITRLDMQLLQRSLFGGVFKSHVTCLWSIID